MKIEFSGTLSPVPEYLDDVPHGGVIAISSESGVWFRTSSIITPHLALIQCVCLNTGKVNYFPFKTRIRALNHVLTVENC